MKHTLPTLFSAIAMSVCLSGLMATADPAQSPSAPAQQAGSYQVSLTEEPQLHVGSNTFHVQVHDASGHAISNAEVTLRLSMPSMHMTGRSVSSTQGDKGDYRLQAAVPMEGSWQAQVVVHPPGQSPVTTTFPLQVGQSGE